tara:strand:- start:76 stop:477 length:402 start_codon:yes stop_codon:yes gene_type:complete
MADSVTSQTIIDTDKRVVQKFTNLSDGSGEAGVVKVDVSALGGAPSRVTIDQIWYDIGGMRVILNFAATSVVPALILGGSAAAGNVSGHMDFRSFGGIKNNAGSGVNGDIKFTTSGHTNLDHYTIVLEMRKSD